MSLYAKSTLQTTIEDVDLLLSSRNLPEDGCYKIVFLETILLIIYQIIVY